MPKSDEDKDSTAEPTAFKPLTEAETRALIAKIQAEQAVLGKSLLGSRRSLSGLVKPARRPGMTGAAKTVLAWATVAALVFAALAAVDHFFGLGAALVVAAVVGAACVVLIVRAFRPMVPR